MCIQPFTWHSGNSCVNFRQMKFSVPAETPPLPRMGVCVSRSRESRVGGQAGHKLWTPGSWSQSPAPSREEEAEEEGLAACPQEPTLGCPQAMVPSSDGICGNEQSRSKWRRNDRRTPCTPHTPGHAVPSSHVGHRLCMWRLWFRLQHSYSPDHLQNG